MVRRGDGRLARLFDEGAVAGLTDGQLLDRFATRGGAAAEAAFAALVARHGPMVARVCRGVLRAEHDVEDAFQATFLVLVRRAGSLGERDLLAPWLYGVAHRVARKARAVAARRRGREGESAGFDPPARADSRAEVRVELGPVLHEEVDRLPAKYRQPVVLCHLQGLTHAEAAQELAWPVGTVSVRLARARQILADRLSRRGVTASVGLVTATLAAEATAAAAPVAPASIQAAALAALAAATGLPLAAAVSAGAATLARRTSMTMLLSSWKWLAVPATVALATTTGAALVGPAGPDQPGAELGQAAAADPRPVQRPGRSPLSKFPKSASGTKGDRADTPAADGMTISGKFADLKTTLENIEGNDPDAVYTLQVSGNRLKLQPPRPAQAAGVPDQPKAGQPVGIAGTRPGGLDLKITQDSRIVEAGQPVTYIFEIKNDGKRPATRIQLRGTLDNAKVVEPLFFETSGRLLQKPAEGDNPGEFVFPEVVGLPVGGTNRFGLKVEAIGEGKAGVAAELISAETADDADATVKGSIATSVYPAPEKPPVVVPPVVALGNGRYELGNLPPDYFDLPAADPGKPGSPRPIRVGQTVQVEVLEALPGRPITGERVVRADGTISLGFYGDLPVVGLTRDQFKVKVVEKLRHYLTDEVLGLIRPWYDEKVFAVPPLETDRVYVDDQPGPRSQAARAEPVQSQPAQGTAAAAGKPTGVQVGEPIAVEVLEALPGRPITGEKVVRPDGTVSLGFYGDVAVAGLTRDQIKVKVIEHLRKTLSDEMLGLRVADPRTGAVEMRSPLQSDRVFVDETVGSAAYKNPTAPAADGRVQVGQILDVEVLKALPNRPITGHRLVTPDGTISLGFYGSVPVVGLTRDQIKVKVIDHLRSKLSDADLGLTREVDGAARPVAPADSTHVFVDDVITPRSPRTSEQVEKLAEQVDDLARKLDEALGAIRTLRAQPAP